MGAPQNLAAFDAMLRDTWVLSKTVPITAFKNAGELYKSMEKDYDAENSGKGVMNYPMETSLPGAGSADFGTSAANGGGANYDQWKVNLRRQFWQTYAVDWETIEFSDGPNAYAMVVPRGLMNTARRHANVMSIYSWGNGGGAVARIATGATVTAGTTVLQLQNVNEAVFFESARIVSGTPNGGDILQFSVDDGTGGAGVKTFETRVIGTNRAAGTLTISPALDGTVAASDYIFFKGTYGAVPQGWRAWCPEDVNKLIGDFNGVDRTAEPDKLGGNRVQISLGASPYDVFTEARKIMKVRGIHADMLAMSSRVWERFEQDMREAGVTVSVNQRGANPDKVALGIQGITFINPGTGKPITAYCDEYLTSHDATAEDDETYCFYAMDEFGLGTGPEGINWRQHAGTGSYLIQIPDQQIVKGYYGVRGNFNAKCPNNMLVMSPTVVEQ